MRHAMPRFEDFAAQDVNLSRADVDRLDAIINHSTVHGHRYNDRQRSTIVTEDSPAG
jgi:hypothetical protein